MIPKFRAWDEIQHKMLQVDCIEFIDGKAYWVEASSADDDPQGGNDGPVRDNSQLKLEQSTGLKDVNGKEIYENDLIRLTDDLEDPIYKVIFDEAKFEIIGGGVCYDLGEEFMDCEVIGNVHNNPELLKADK